MKMQYAKIKILKNMITSTTSGWFNLFIKENFNLLRLSNPEHILEKIKELQFQDSDLNYKRQKGNSNE